MLSHVQLCNPRGCSPPDSSVHGIFQAKLLEWVFALFFLMLFYGILSLYLFIPVIVFWSLVVDSQWQDNTTVKNISCFLLSNYILVFLKITKKKKKVWDLSQEKLNACFVVKKKNWLLDYIRLAKIQKASRNLITKCIKYLVNIKEYLFISEI